MNIKIKLEQNGMMPVKEFPSSAGYDLFIPEDIIVPIGRSIIPLNFRIDLPEGYGAFIFARSGMAAKGIKGYNIYDRDTLCRFNCDIELGLVDCGYKGIVGIIIHNHERHFKLKAGDSIAQMVIQKCESPELDLVSDFSLDGERGEQGFNS